MAGGGPEDISLRRDEDHEANDQREEQPPQPLAGEAAGGPVAERVPDTGPSNQHPDQIQVLTSRCGPPVVTMAA